MTASNTKRLARNTLVMYIRMGIIMIIAIYSSRILLKTLGIEDYGTYNLVGSIIAMVSMLQGMFTTATQRFLNYEMGRNDISKMKIVFNMSIRVNTIIAIIFVIAVEVVGLWFFYNKINIDIDRIIAAQWVFHLAVISSVFLIFNSTFDALVIAHEHMGFFAFVSVLRNLLNLVIIFLLPCLGNDRLITYGWLLLGVTILICTITTIYCKYNFIECRLAKLWDKDIFKQMFSFAGWQMFGNTAYVLTQNGLNLVFNIFGGMVVNAARGIAYQFYTIVSSFLNNVILAITPYSVKTYAAGDIDRTLQMFYFSSKILFVVNICIVIPLLYLTPEILILWLDVIPEHTIGFIRLILIWSTIRSLHYPFDVLFKAVGKIKNYQITEGIILSLPLVFSYFLLKAGMSFNTAFSSIIIFEIIDIFVVMYWAKKIVGLQIREYLLKILLHVAICMLIEIVVFLFISQNCYQASLNMIIAIFSDCLILCYFYLYVLSGTEKHALKRIINLKK